MHVLALAFAFALVLGARAAPCTPRSLQPSAPATWAAYPACAVPSGGVWGVYPRFAFDNACTRSYKSEFAFYAQGPAVLTVRAQAGLVRFRLSATRAASPLAALGCPFYTGSSADDASTIELAAATRGNETAASLVLPGAEAYIVGVLGWAYGPSGGLFRQYGLNVTVAQDDFLRDGDRNVTTKQTDNGFSVGFADAENVVFAYSTCALTAVDVGGHCPAPCTSCVETLEHACDVGTRTCTCRYFGDVCEPDRCYATGEEDAARRRAVLDVTTASYKCPSTPAASTGVGVGLSPVHRWLVAAILCQLLGA